MLTYRTQEEGGCNFTATSPCGHYVYDEQGNEIKRWWAEGCDAAPSKSCQDTSYYYGPAD